MQIIQGFCPLFRSHTPIKVVSLPLGNKPVIAHFCSASVHTVHTGIWNSLLMLTLVPCWQRLCSWWLLGSECALIQRSVVLEPGGSYLSPENPECRNSAILLFLNAQFINVSGASGRAEPANTPLLTDLIQVLLVTFRVSSTTLALNSKAPMVFSRARNLPLL